MYLQKTYDTVYSEPSLFIVSVRPQNSQSSWDGHPSIDAGLKEAIQ